MFIAFKKSLQRARGLHRRLITGSTRFLKGLHKVLPGV